jgi:hypothetical protein
MERPTQPNTKSKICLWKLLVQIFVPLQLERPTAENLFLQNIQPRLSRLEISLIGLVYFL